MKDRILFVCNVDWFFISHRLEIAIAAKNKNFEVYVAASDTGRSSEITQHGIYFVNLSFSRSGVNIFFELCTLFKFLKTYSLISPTIVHNITLKPVLYGSIISKLLNINVVNSISGLGYNFTGKKKSFVQRVMLFLMRYGFNRERVGLIFQNTDDFKELFDLKIISKKNKIFYIKGVGVNLDTFRQSSQLSTNKIIILFPSRMLWHKGVLELYHASFMLKEKYKNKIQFLLAGFADDDNKAGVTTSFLKKWSDGEYVKWIGYQRNIKEVFEHAHIVVLPSYREGMPKSLIEACAMGKAIITTNAIGCKECVDDGVNGIIVPIYDANALATAIEYMINNPNLIVSMGNASRVKAKKEFDINSVINDHLLIYTSIK